MSGGKHAFLSPSFGKIGYACPASSIRSFQVKQRQELMREILPEFYGLKSKASVDQLNAALAENNTMATEGTALHVIFEDCLNARKCSHAIVQKAVRNSTEVRDSTKKDDYIISMLDKVIREQIKFVQTLEWSEVEKKVKVKGLPDFGTVDLVGFGGDILYIRDLKTGYTEVESEDNEQLMTYAVGLLDEFGWGKFKKVKIQILGVRWQAEEWTTTPAHLLKFKKEVMLPAFMKAYSINPPAIAGSHCLYCAAKIHCAEWQKEFSGLENEIFDADVVDLSTEELTHLYKLCKQAENLGKYTISPELLQRFDGFGDIPTGVTRVSGRVNERWSTGEDEVVKRFKGKVKNKNLLYSESLKSPKQIKLIVKNDELFDGMVSTTVNSPHLRMK